MSPAPIKTCTYCGYYKLIEAAAWKRGECYRYPPVPVLDSAGKVFNVRPLVDHSTPVCGEFVSPVALILRGQKEW